MSSLTGDVAELVCSVRGKPTPEVQWRKDGGLETIYIYRQVPRLTSCGSQAGDQCLLKGVIFLFELAQLRIGYGWASMAHIWNSTHLRKPLSTAQPSIHPLSALQVLILGRLQFASNFAAPPISLRLQFGEKSVMEYGGKRNWRRSEIGGELEANWRRTKMSTSKALSG